MLGQSVAAPRAGAAQLRKEFTKEKSKRNESRTRSTCNLQEQWKQPAKTCDVWKQVLKNRRGLEKIQGTYHLPCLKRTKVQKRSLQKLLRARHRDGWITSIERQRPPLRRVF